MDPDQTNVKRKRSYDATGRQEQASRNRARVIDSAEGLLLRDGYADTTVAGIAEAAGVSVDTIYKSFGGKAGLVRAIRARALAGDRSAPAEQRSDELQAREADPIKIIQGWGRLTAEIAPRVSPILLLIRDAAATDGEVRLLLDELDADRRRRMALNARRLRDAKHLRPGVTLAHAADVLWTYSSPELYELLVVRRRWSARRYGRFIADAMIHELL